MNLRLQSATILLILFALTVPGCSRASVGHARRHVKAQSAILFIGDGMGLGQVVGGRLWTGGAESRLVMESFPVTGFSRTWSTDANVTDSAAGGTALATGVKTSNGTIAMTDKAWDPAGRSRPIESLATAARAQGKSIGVISTSRVTDATPAVFYAHVPNRSQEDQIADQLAGSGLTLLLGGGRSHFFPTNWQDPEAGTGKRADGRNLVDDLTKQGWTYVDSAAAFKQLDPARKDQKVLGLFNPDSMQYDIERGQDKLGEPALAEMVAFAIRVLSQNPKGYFLMVEGGCIDHGCHEVNARKALGDVAALDQAIGQALKQVDGKTLLVVTADHETGGLSLVLGGLDAHKRIQDHPAFSGAQDKHKENEVVNWGGVVIRATDFERKSYGGDSAPHTGVDVPVMAKGPGSRQFTGFMNNCDIPWRIARAMGLEFKDPVNVENRQAFLKKLNAAH